MKKYTLTILFFVFGLTTVLSQRPKNTFSSKKTTDPRRVQYTIKKSPVSSVEHADFGAYMNNGKMYFLSDRKSWPVSWKDEYQQAFLDLFVVDLKTDSEVQFAGPRKNDKLNEGPICFTKDGTRVYYTRDYSGRIKKGDSIPLAIYTARVKGDKWVDEKSLSINNQNYSVGHPAVSNNGKYLYFSSNRPGGKGGSDIYRAEIKENGDVGKAELLPGDVNTHGNELFPSIGSNDELYFSSTGHEGLGGMDIFMALFKGDQYTRIKNVGYPINSPKDDFAYVLGASNKGYFSTNRDGNDDIYSFHQIIPFRFTPVLSGVITLEDVDAREGIIIELLDENNNLISSQTTKEKGNYSFDLKEEMQYNVRVTKNGYDPLNMKVSTKGNGFGLTNDIVLKKDNGVVISLQLIALKTGLAVEGAKVRMTNNLTNEVFMSELSDPSGIVSEPMLKLKEGDSLDLSIKVAKEGYLTKEVHFTHRLSTMDDIELQDFFGNALKMNRIGIGLRLGTDVANLIDIKPIIFDSTDVIIQPRAGKELDKIVAFMNENPSIRIELRCHTDSRGSATSNLSISSKRAEAAVKYLVQKGIVASRLSDRGYGEKKLLNNCQDGTECTEEQHQENNRIEFIITKS
ncbi:MAG: OmpA family protein [Crocinitomicaceae bacterium]|nr:OmpA family protein [Crocinitomicaceae bacterium]